MFEVADLRRSVWRRYLPLALLLSGCATTGFHVPAGDRAVAEAGCEAPCDAVGAANPLDAGATEEQAALGDSRQDSTLLGRIWQDHKNFYSGRNAVRLGVGAGIGAVLANTKTDEKLNDAFQENVRDADTDEWSEYLRFHKDFGDGLYLLPVYGGMMVVGNQWGDSSCGAGTFGEWGERSLRATLVGGPPMLLAQRLTGGSRPGETSHGSHWRPLQDENGVSGHTFMGAVPFLTAAEMTDNLFAKSVLYAGSTLVGLSRINDEAHYPSQAFLGWWMAYAATRAVGDTNDGAVRVVPLDAGTGEGLGFEWIW